MRCQSIAKQNFFRENFEKLLALGFEEENSSLKNVEFELISTTKLFWRVI